MKSNFIRVFCMGIGVMVIGWGARESHKEVFYLCSNLVKGEPKTSVFRQFNTTHFADYSVENNRVVLNSVFNLYLTRCEVVFDGNDLIELVVLDSA